MHVPLKEEISDRQVCQVLAVIRDLQPYLLAEVVEVGGTPKSRNIDGGVESAAGTTFLNACARLDSFLQEESRWSMKAHNTLVSEMVKTHRAQQKFIAIQSESAAMLQAPHYQLRPTLAIAGAEFIAYFGSLTEPGQAIVGRGKTPREALFDFDLAFERTPDQQLIVIAEKAGVELPKNPPT